MSVDCLLTRYPKIDTFVHPQVRGFRACLVAQYYESLDSDTVTKLEPCLGIERLRKLIKKPIEQARQYSQHLLRTSKIDRGNMYF